MGVWQNCEKCGKEHWREPENEHTIQGKLCDKCKILWQKFFKANYEEIEKHFPPDAEHNNPTWLAFIGEEYCTPERVLLT